VKVDANKIKYQLKRLVCTEEESHAVLAGSNNVIDVVKDLPMFFKINVA